MLTLLDAVALSTWEKARKPRLGEFLRALTRAPAAAHPPDVVAAALEYAAGVGPMDALAAALRERAAVAMEDASRAHIVPVPWGDPLYPPLLAAIHDPPPVLWVRGRAEALSRPAVALVGSRAASPYGIEAATRLASDLSMSGATIVSGLARGVDSAAHRGALAVGGLTVAVLGSGADVIYPPEHDGLAASIADTGAVVSELPPGTAPRALHFPARNRIISGLSLGVVVVEAAERSGSLITAEFALEQGREVFAVPGSILSGRYRGCHGLIRDGAALVDSAEDVAWELRGTPLGRAVGSPGEGESRSRSLLDLMAPGESYDVDHLARQAALSPPVLLSCLLELELQGAVRRTGGGRFVRVGRTC